MKIWSRNDVACRLLRKEWEWEIGWWNIPDSFIVGFLLRQKFFTFYRESENLITWKMGSNLGSSYQRVSLCYVRISGELEELGTRDNVGGNICPTNWFEFLIKLSDICKLTFRIVFCSSKEKNEERLTLTHLLAILIILCLAPLAVLTAQCQQFIIHFPPGEQHLAGFTHYTFRHSGKNLNFSFFAHSARVPWSVL